MVFVTKAEPEDLAVILELQKRAYRSEAEIYQDFSIPPLVQTLQGLVEEARGSVVLKAVENSGPDRTNGPGRPGDGLLLVGSVRVTEKAGTCYINKLMVAPDCQNRGIGKMLLAAAENACPARRYELFTGHLSLKNLALYEKLGYRPFKVEAVSERLNMVFLEKIKDRGAEAPTHSKV